MSRLARSWEMTKTSFSVIKQDKELLWMPVLSFIATLVAVAAILGLGFVGGLFGQVTSEAGVDIIGLLWAFSLYLAVAFVQVFFHAATVAGAHERLSGGDPTVGSALGKAWKHVGRLFLWSIVVATVNVILQIIRERAGFVGQIMAGIAGVAWNLATYFVVPILLFEDKGIGESLKRSGGLFKKTWGESVVGEIGIGWAAMFVSIAVLFVGIAITVGLGAVLAVPGLVIGIVLTVAALIVTAVVFSVAQAVYKTALFRYAQQGHAGGPFQDMTMANAWRPT